MQDQKENKSTLSGEVLANQSQTQVLTKILNEVNTRRNEGNLSAIEKYLSSYDAISALKSLGKVMYVWYDNDASDDTKIRSDVAYFMEGINQLLLNIALSEAGALQRMEMLISLTAEKTSNTLIK